MSKSQQSVKLSAKNSLESKERPENGKTYELFLILYGHCCGDGRWHINQLRSLWRLLNRFFPFRDQFSSMLLLKKRANTLRPAILLNELGQRVVGSLLALRLNKYFDRYKAINLFYLREDFSCRLFTRYLSLIMMKDTSKPLLAEHRIDIWFFWNSINVDGNS